MQEQQPGQGFPSFSTPPGHEQHVGIAPVVEEEEGWGKIGIVMVTLAVIFAGGVAYFIATSSGEELEAAHSAGQNEAAAT